MVRSRGGVAEMGAEVQLPKGGTLSGSEGLVLRVCSDGNPYIITLTTGMCVMSLLGVVFWVCCCEFVCTWVCICVHL